MSKFLFTFLGLFFWGANALCNIIGADTQNFNPTTSGLDYITVHSSKTLHPGVLNTGAFLNYAVNSLPNYEDTTTQTRTNFRDLLLSSDITFGYGLTRHWDVGVSWPALLSQNVDTDLEKFRAQFEQTGTTEIRFNTKYRLLGDSAGGLAVIGSLNRHLIENNPFTGKDPGPTFNMELAWDTEIRQYRVAANVGYRWRDPGRKVIREVQPLEDQWIASGALSYYHTPWNMQLITEIYGSAPVQPQKFASDREVASAEALTGVKANLRHDLTLQAGVGTKLIHGTAAPDWRVYSGLTWALGPLFSDPKSVMMRVQKDSAESLRAFEKRQPFQGEPQPKESFVARDILFEFNSARVKPEFKDILEVLAQYLQKPPGFKRLVIEGHTDSVGSQAYNKQLSRKRAKRVREVLIALGLSPEKINAIGYGEKKPIASNNNYQGRSLNRRVEFRVLRE